MIVATQQEGIVRRRKNVRGIAPSRGELHSLAEFNCDGCDAVVLYSLSWSSIMIVDLVAAVLGL